MYKNDCSAFTLGICGIMKSSETQAAKERGDLQAAKAHSSSAQGFLIAGFVCGIFCSIIYGVILFLRLQAAKDDTNHYNHY